MPCYYSKTLRESPMWAALEPLIIQAKLEEACGILGDFEFNFGRNGEQRLYVLALDAASVDEKSDHGLSNSAWAAPWEKTLWIFVYDKHNEDRSTRAYMRLQALMLDLTSLSKPIRGPHIILVPTPAMIIAYITTYIEELQNQPTVPCKLPVDELTPVAYACVTPLVRSEAQLLFKLFESVKDLEQATRTEDGLRLLRENFHEVTVKSLVDFWKNEWVL